MRAFIVAVIFAVVAVSNAALKKGIDPKDILKFKEECVTESGIDEKTLAMLPMGNEDHKPPTPEQIKALESSKEAKCFGMCLAVKFGFFDKDGKPQFDVVKEVFDLKDDDEALAVAKKCAEDNNGESDVCERVHKIHKCVMMALHKKKL